MFFNGWNGLVRVLVVGTIAYAVLVLFLRLSGKRTLAKLNAFDLVVTVALGSTLSSILITKSVALLEGLLALALLIFLQYAIAWLSIRSQLFRALVKSEPTLVYHRGEFLEAALRAQRLTRDEVLAAIRSSGTADFERVAAVVLETDGSVSVMADAYPGTGALENVAGG